MLMLLNYDFEKVREVFLYSRDTGFDEIQPFVNNAMMRQSMPEGITKVEDIHSDDSFGPVKTFDDEKKTVDRSMPEMVIRSLDLTKLKRDMRSNTPRIDSKNSQVMIDSVTFRETK